MTSTRESSLTGFFLAIGSAGSFALSGIFASALMDAGWSAGAATTARISFAALTLLIPTCVMLRGKWYRVLQAWPQLILFGGMAVAGCQLAYFLAVQYIPPSLALLLEFMGPVLLMLWMWARTRLSPGLITIFGAVLAFGGLITISGVAVGGSLHPLGVLFGLVAAIGNAAYYAAGARSDHGIPPLPFVGLGLAVGAIVLGVVNLLGIIPFEVTAQSAVVAGREFPAWLIVTAMVLISTVLSYTLGVAASRRLGATVASFTGYSEPMFGIVWTILLLSVVPTGTQWIGAALIIAGVVTVKIGEVLRARTVGAAPPPATGPVTIVGVQ